MDVLFRYGILELLTPSFPEPTLALGHPQLRNLQPQVVNHLISLLHTSFKPIDNIHEVRYLGLMVLHLLLELGEFVLGKPGRVELFIELRDLGGEVIVALLPG